MSDDPAQPRDWWAQPALIVVVCALLAFAVSPATGDWHYDDSHHVEKNPAIRSLANVPRFFTDSGTFSAMPHHRLYRPVLMTTFALDWAVWGGNAHGYLTTNLLVHLLSALAVLALARRILGPGRGALLAGIAFAVHPILSETVCYVGARSSSLATLFGVLAILAHLTGGDRKGARALPWHLLSYALFAAGLGTKAIAVTVPFLAVLAAWSRDVREERETTWLQRLLPVLPMFLVAAGWFVLVQHQVGNIAGSLAKRIATPQEGAGLARAKRSVVANLATQARVFWIYVGLVLVPVDLAVDRYVRVSEGFGDPMALLSLAGIVVLVALAFRSRWIPLRFGILWFGIALLPTSSVKPLLVVMNEHRLYLPMVGAAIAIGAGLAALATSRWRQVAVGAVVVLWIGLSFVRVLDWRSEETLWQAALRTSPRSYQAHLNLGNLRFIAAKEAERRSERECRELLDEAMAHYRRAEEIFPDFFNVQFNLGLIHLARGRMDDDAEALDAARKHFRACLELAPGSTRARWFLAECLAAEGKDAEALRRFEELRDEDVDCGSTLYHYPIGKLLTRLERWEEAEAVFRDIQRIDGDTLETRAGLASLFEARGDHEQAESLLRVGVEGAPRDFRHRVVLARFLVRTGRGRRGEVERLFQESVQMGYRPTPKEVSELLEGGAPAPDIDEEAQGTSEGDRR
jgi:tetratricopeptide (TPR) repeat protein